MLNVAALFTVGTIVRFIRETSISKETAADHEIPREKRVTTFATMVKNVVARDKVLRRKNDIDLAVSGNAESVRKDFSSSESPAITAGLLVHDFLY